jgi:hypothetical protein
MTPYGELDGGEWSASRPGHFTQGETAPPYPLDRRMGGIQSRSGRCGWEKNLLRLPGIEPQFSSHYPAMSMIKLHILTQVILE